MKAVIIEDEKNGREILTRLLERHCPEILVCAEADSMDSGMRAIQKHTPEVVFLDIKLGNENSFDLLRQVDRQRYNFNIIFTTAYEEFAIPAIRSDAIDYLLKPIDAIELRSAVSKLLQRQKSALSESSLGKSRRRDLPQKIKIHNRNGFDLIDMDDILYCLSEVNYTRFYLKDKKTILTSKTLKHYQQILEEFWFLRIHKSIIVNVKEVTSYKNSKGGQVVMSNEEILEVGSSFKAALLDELAS